MALSKVFQENIKNVSFSFLIGGITLLLFTINSYSYNSLIGTMFGYTTITFAILLLGIMSYATISSTTTEPTSWQSAILIMSQMSPFIFFLTILILSIVLTNSYLHKLTTTEVPKSFKSFNVTSIVLIITQTALLIYTLNKSSSSSDTPNISFFENRIENTKLKLLGIVNLIVLFTSFICIKYLSTDG